MRAAKWLTTGEIAQRLGRSHDNVRRLIERGVFPSAQRPTGGHWRVLAEDVARWIESVRPRRR